MAINRSPETLCIHFLNALRRMMSKRMLKYKSELKLLATCLPSTARLLFKQAPNEFIRAIIDATWTTLSGKLNLTPHDLDQVKSVQPALRRIATRGQTFDKRRRVLSTSSGIKAIQKLMSIVQAHF